MPDAECSHADSYLDLVSLSQDCTHIRDAIMTDLANVQQPAHAVAQIHKGTIRRDGLNDTLGYVTNLQPHKICQSGQYGHSRDIGCLKASATEGVV